MRIIGGRARGRRLQALSKSTAKYSSQLIRPTADRAREALFNIIGSEVENATVLDLYAGTGALGLEALSRSAEQAVFV
ncbi:MAG: RsmD family RNA methyltransferase, partial [Desulfobulbaceae bacterium]|nr:RsmD family RNA methyltransferase [Desulfobulbaceae bacterium]